MDLLNYIEGLFSSFYNFIIVYSFIVYLLSIILDVEQYYLLRPFKAALICILLFLPSLNRYDFQYHSEYKYRAFFIMVCLIFLGVITSVYLYDIPRFLIICLFTFLLCYKVAGVVKIKILELLVLITIIVFFICYRILFNKFGIMLDTFLYGTAAIFLIVFEWYFGLGAKWQSLFWAPVISLIILVGLRKLRKGFYTVYYDPVTILLNLYHSFNKVNRNTPQFIIKHPIKSIACLAFIFIFLLSFISKPVLAFELNFLGDISYTVNNKLIYYQKSDECYPSITIREKRYWIALEYKQYAYARNIAKINDMDYLEGNLYSNAIKENYEIILDPIISCESGNYKAPLVIEIYDPNNDIEELHLQTQILYYLSTPSDDFNEINYEIYKESIVIYTPGTYTLWTHTYNGIATGSTMIEFTVEE